MATDRKKKKYQKKQYYWIMKQQLVHKNQHKLKNIKQQNVLLEWKIKNGAPDPVVKEQINLAVQQASGPSRMS